MAQPPPPELARRFELQDILEAFVPDGSKVYFQPEENIALVYPCIVYQRDYSETSFADNFPWRNTPRYQVTIMDRNPDSDISVNVSKLPMCTFERYFTKGDLNHDIYKLYY